jgi:MFS family permease
MIVSGTCAAVAGFLYHAPAPLLFVFTAVWGATAVADSAQLSALVAQYSPRDHVGTVLTMQTCVGFLLTMASIRLLPVAAQSIGWQWVFLLLAPGPSLGVLALRGLGRQTWRVRVGHRVKYGVGHGHRVKYGVGHGAGHGVGDGVGDGAGYCAELGHGARYG